jgi:copper chaperone
MAEINIKIEGMSCEHCVMAVKKALNNLPAVIESNVKIGSALVKYDDSKGKVEDIKKAIEKAGYKVSE